MVARRQTGGRGRLDHGWFSPSGGLYLSLVLSSPIPTPLLPLALGARLLESFRERYGVPAALQWPNDLYVVAPGRPARKLGGILVDRVDSPALGSAAVAGIGINVVLPRADVPPELAGRVASLGEFVRPPPELTDLEHDVAANAVDAAHALAAPGGAEAAVRRCRELLHGAGRWAVVDGRLRGRIAGLGDDGALLLDVGAERVSIRAGELRVEDDR